MSRYASQATQNLDYQESLTTGQTDTLTDIRLPDRQTHRQRKDQATQKGYNQESVTTGQTDTQTDAGQIYPYVLLCFAGDT